MKKESEIKITLNDFIKIFRSSKASESLLNLIQKESEKRYKNNFQSMPVSDFPKKRFEHPKVRAERD